MLKAVKLLKCILYLNCQVNVLTAYHSNGVTIVYDHRLNLLLVSLST